MVEIELTQWRIARKEAEEYIKENPRLAQRCLSLFTSNNPYLGSIANLKEIKEFYQSTSLKLKQASSQAEIVSAAAPPAINDKDKANNRLGIVLPGVIAALGIVIVCLMVLLRKRASSHKDSAR